MTSIVSIGGATYDLFVRTGDTGLSVDTARNAILLPLGHKVRVEELIESSGGGATNTAVGLSRLGCAAAFCGILGSDQWGERMLQDLEKEGVDVRGATIVEGETSSFSIILTAPGGERTILYSTGTSAHLHDVTFDTELIAGADWVYFNHIHEKSCVIEDDLVRVLQEKHIGMTWNPGGRQLTQGMDGLENRALLAHTDLLLLNKEEAMTFTGKKTTEGAIKALLAAGAKIVCISDGGNGCTASDGRDLYHCPAFKDAVIVDTTGAGDAFGTGATWALVQGFELPMILKTGTISATSVLARIGAKAGLLTDIEMQTRLKDCDLDVDVRSL